MVASMAQTKVPFLCLLGRFIYVPTVPSGRCVAHEALSINRGLGAPHHHSRHEASQASSPPVLIHSTPAVMTIIQVCKSFILKIKQQKNTAPIVDQSVGDHRSRGRR